MLYRSHDQHSLVFNVMMVMMIGISYQDHLFQLDMNHFEEINIKTLDRCVRTRLYFTSESHMHTLLNVLRYPGPDDTPIICQNGLDLMDSIPEINYLSQIVIRLFEDSSNPFNLHCELSFSPGAINDPIHDKSSSIAPSVLLGTVSTTLIISIQCYISSYVTLTTYLQIFHR